MVIMPLASFNTGPKGKTLSKDFCSVGIPSNKSVNFSGIPTVGEPVVKQLERFKGPLKSMLKDFIDTIRPMYNYTWADFAGSNLNRSVFNGGKIIVNPELLGMAFIKTYPTGQRTLDMAFNQSGVLSSLRLIEHDIDGYVLKEYRSNPIEMDAYDNVVRTYKVIIPDDYWGKPIKSQARSEFCYSITFKENDFY